MPGSPARRVHVVSPGGTYVGRQGFTYGSGASAETVGAQQVCMNVLPMPDGARAKVHYHKGIETIAYLLEGECVAHYGDALEEQVIVHTGEQVFVPADVPHAPSNESGVPCKWLVVHASGSDQDGIVLLPELDDLLTSRLSSNSNREPSPAPADSTSGHLFGGDRVGCEKRLSPIHVD